MRKAILLLLATSALSLFGQQPPAAPPAGGGQARPAPKNLKILKAEDVRAAMGMFVAGTGLNCMGCHVQGDFASDEKHEKVVARKMIEMANELNAKNFGGAMKVTCFTCHRGEAHPKTAPDPK